MAGSESSLFQGQAKVIIKGNAAAANGNAGDAAGIGEENMNVSLI